MKKLIICFFLVLLVGCASTTIVQKNPKSITLKYDPVLEKLTTIMARADRHCAQYGKVAVPDRRYTTWGGLRTYTFKCE